MLFLTKANLKAHSRQYVATAIAIIICCVFICGASSFASVMSWVMGVGETQFNQNTQVQITREVDLDNPDSSQAIQGTVSWENTPDNEYEVILKKQDAIRNAVGKDLDLQPLYYLVTLANINEKNIYLSGTGLLPKGYYRPPLAEGRYPTGKNEIILGESYLENGKTKIGDQIELKTDELLHEHSAKEKTIPVTITGTVKQDATMRIGNLPDVYYSAQLTKQLSDFSKESPAKILINTQQDPKAVVQKLGKYLNDNKLLSQDGWVVTVDELQKSSDSDLAKSVAMQAASLAFPLLAVLVCIGIVSVTFQVVLARRRRETALLRCVGATVSQIRRSAFSECVMVGVIAALLGTALGWTASVVVAVATGMIGSFTQAAQVIGFTPAVVSLLTGIIVPLIGGMRPTLGLAKILPVAALNPMELTKMGKKKRHIVRGVFMALFTLVGAGLWTFAWLNKGQEDDQAMTIALSCALGGCLFIFLAALLACRSFLPAFTAALTRPFASRSATFKLAGENVKRDPNRTGATGTALVLGVTLMATILVGTISLQSTIADELNRRFSVDMSLVAVNESHQMPEEITKKLPKLQSVDKVASLPSRTITQARDEHDKPVQLNLALEQVEPYEDEKEATASSAPEEGETGNTSDAVDTDSGNQKPENRSVLAVGLPDNPEAVLRHQVKTPQKGTAWLMTEDERKHPSKVTLTFASGQKLTVALKAPPQENQAFPSSAFGSYLVLSRADLDSITPSETGKNPAGVILKMDMEKTPTEIMEDIQDLSTLAPADSLAETGGVMFTASINLTLKVLMTILLSLLGVSALVALVGVANTLSLSVVDRKRENALLRAVGFTQKQIRAMLLTEGMLIGLGALIVGIALSILFSWFVMQCMPFTGFISSKDIHVQIPWLWLGIIILVTEGFCFLASVLPGRQAAKASPVAALASADE
ncbi:MAG: FtsX-like permease family protein [Varibaculum cambriense]|uniref:ABC transporter permease n=1 Tax=Varibaculum cambriense TaxID=184870 RepID=UPI0029128634|nr:FtsX-like permease family protein [Varibaculum cambriense]MDU4945777.1 FtsX-like permease family protein [Varibaculum cambriense]